MAHIEIVDLMLISPTSLFLNMVDFPVFHRFSTLLLFAGHAPRGHIYRRHGRGRDLRAKETSALHPGMRFLEFHWGLGKKKTQGYMEVS